MPRLGLGLLGLGLAAGLTASAARADEPNKDTAALESRLSAMQRQIDDNKRLAELALKALDQFNSQLLQQRNVQELKDQLSTTQLEMQKALAEVRQLREQMAALQKDAGSTSAKPAESSTSQKVPLAMPYAAESAVSGSIPGPAVAAAKATVQIVNQDYRTQVVFVGGERYVVPPFRTVNLDFTPGAITYFVELWMPNPTTYVLKPNEVKQIKIYTIR